MKSPKKLSVLEMLSWRGWAQPHYPSYSWGVGSSSSELGDTTDVGFSSVFAFFGFFGSACERNRFAPHLRQCTFLESISVQLLPPQNAQGPFICFLTHSCFGLDIVARRSLGMTYLWSSRSKIVSSLSGWSLRRPGLPWLSALWAVILSSQSLILNTSEYNKNVPVKGCILSTPQSFFQSLRLTSRIATSLLDPIAFLFITNSV